MRELVSLGTATASDAFVFVVIAIVLVVVVVVVVVIVHHAAVGITREIKVRLGDIGIARGEAIATDLLQLVVGWQARRRARLGLFLIASSCSG